MISTLAVTREEALAAVAQVAGSSTLRGKETAQRLLAYLADRTLEGSAGALKEYTIGIECFGKPTDYDPQLDASVRVQIGRLRQKLEEYAGTEGRHDPILIELPKRQFALQFHPQPSATAPLARQEEVALPAISDGALSSTAPPSVRRFSWPSLLVGALIVALAWVGWSLWPARTKERVQAPVIVTPELQELWRPFLESRRPLTMAIAMRPFLRYDHGVIWDWRLSALPPEQREAPTRALRQQLQTARLAPWEKTYTSFGEATSIFLLTKMFERQGRALQLKRSDALTWEEIAEQDVIFIGAGKEGVPFDRIPVRLAFEQHGNRIVNLQPEAGEPSAFTTPNPDPKDFMQQEDYALISVVPGLHGKGEIMALGGVSSSGLWAAGEYLTEPRYVRELVAKLKGATGKLPRYYQVIIQARFQSLVPIEIQYVTHREL